MENHRLANCGETRTEASIAYCKGIRLGRHNRGKYTPVVDHTVWLTPRQKMLAVKMLKRRGYHSQPLSRIHIPKKNGKLRPLGIPTMIDRSQQALHLLALDPIAETSRIKIPTGSDEKGLQHDAIEQCFKALAKKQSAKWILEGDIKSCFGEISSDWILSHVTMDKYILKQWLEAGFIEKGTFHHTTRGTAQGGVHFADDCKHRLRWLRRSHQKDGCTRGISSTLCVI